MNIGNRNSRLKFKNVARSIKVPSIGEEGLDGGTAEANLSLDCKTADASRSLPSDCSSCSLRVPSPLF